MREPPYRAVASTGKFRIAARVVLSLALVLTASAITARGRSKFLASTVIADFWFLLRGGDPPINRKREVIGRSPTGKRTGASLQFAYKYFKRLA